MPSSSCFYTSPALNCPQKVAQRLLLLPVLLLHLLHAWCYNPENLKLLCCTGMMEIVLEYLVKKYKAVVGHQLLDWHPATLLHQY